MLSSKTAQKTLENLNQATHVFLEKREMGSSIDKTTSVCAGNLTPLQICNTARFHGLLPKETSNLQSVINHVRSWFSVTTGCRMNRLPEDHIRHFSLALWSELNDTKD